MNHRLGLMLSVMLGAPGWALMGGTELGLKGGVAIPTGDFGDEDISIGQGDLLKNSGAFGVDFFYPFANYWSSGLEVGYSFGHKIEGEFSGATISSDIKEKVLHINPAFRFEPFREHRWPIRPYGIFGFGYYRLWNNSGTATICVPGLCAQGAINSDSDNLFGVNGGGGFSIPLTPTISLAAEARWHRVFSDGKKPFHPTSGDLEYVEPAVRLSMLWGE